MHMGGQGFADHLRSGEALVLRSGGVTLAGHIAAPLLVGGALTLGLLSGEWQLLAVAGLFLAGYLWMLADRGQEVRFVAGDPHSVGHIELGRPGTSDRRFRIVDLDQWVFFGKVDRPPGFLEQPEVMLQFRGGARHRFSGRGPAVYWLKLTFDLREEVGG